MKTALDVGKLPDTDCGCQRCVDMCRSRPCWGTPADIRPLIEDGHAHLLMCDYWAASEESDYEEFSIISPAVVGYGGERAPFWPGGLCGCLTEDGRCLLRELGYYLTKARKTDHSDDLVRFADLHWSVAATWNTPEGCEVVKLWMKSMRQNNGSR